MRRAAIAFAAGTVAGAFAHKRWVGPAFALAAVRQILAAHHEAIESVTRQNQE